jgi:hypothetical protein
MYYFNIGECDLVFDRLQDAIKEAKIYNVLKVRDNRGNEYYI